MAALVGTGAILAPAFPTHATTQVANADPEADMLLFSAYPFDTQRTHPVAPAPFSMNPPAGDTLQVVQFTGPIQQKWLTALSVRGIKPVQYVANNGYIVWTDAAAKVQLEHLRTTQSWLQFATPYYGFLKVDPALGDALAKNTLAATNDEVDVIVQVYRHDNVQATRQFITSKGILPPRQLGPVGSGKADYIWAPVLAYENVKLRVHIADVPAIAERPDVTFVGTVSPRRMMDEKQDIIMTGDFSPSMVSIDYLQFLINHGFSQSAADYPIVDLTDSTIDEGGTGVTVLNTTDPRLHVGGSVSNPVRVSYFKNCSNTPSTSVGAIDGHGSLNAGIIVGYDQTTGSPYQDSDGHQLGLGINPFGRVGSTAIFVPGFDISACGGTDQGVIAANWSNGARISSNSWGLTVPPTTYDDGDQSYDAGVRDADPVASGNQEMIYIFSAANDGPGAATVSSPASGKNVITVGASENTRPTWADGCGVPATGADNANDVIDFSSRGPAPGQRAKPEVIGPGTHIQSGASNYSGYTGTGVCDKYHPVGQTVFAASSGTSHSTPATAGIASLAFWWIEHNGAGAAAGTVDEIGGNRAPSPALMKAWMMAHPTYLTGVGANDNLPSNSQGYGMPNMTSMFDATPKVLLDQSEVFDNTGETRSYTWGVVDSTKPVRIAMTYTDAPGALGTSPQVNNLDLKVAVGGHTYLGNRFDHAFSIEGGTADTKNNYEAVFLPAGTTGDVTITVTATNIAGNGIPNVGDATDQDFALVCSNCSQAPSFTLAATTHVAEICAGTDFSSVVNIGSIQSFSDPVALALSGAPPGATAAVVPTTVNPGDAATVSVTDSSGVAAGEYTMTLTGMSGSITKTLDFDLTYATAAPLTPVLDAPADGSTNTTLTPTLTWEPSPQATSYLVEVATDPSFATPVASATVTDTAWTVSPALNSNTQFYWRVTALNACGDSATAAGDRIFGDGFEGEPLPPIGTASQSFITMALPGDCSIGSTQQVIWSDDLESGAGTWAHSGTGDTWTLGSTAHSGTHAWQASNATVVTDQRLVSPSVVLPAELSGLTLSFWNQQSMESTTGACYDGAIMEVSTDAGTNWTQALPATLLTDPYDGLVSSGFQNPLGGKQAWCGDPQAYLNSVIDLSSFAGQTVQFRFRMANDSSAAHANPGWAIDDVKVAGCATN
ncbi:MAG: S8 family serine peptidase [Dokdonella sp.]|uniref:S8 family serine peptidase n=1 Tax=Dokdonella sp. TaxID=2291710 RepID=UPI00326792D7